MEKLLQQHTKTGAIWEIAVSFSGSWGEEFDLKSEVNFWENKAGRTAHTKRAEKFEGAARKVTASLG